MINWAWKEVPDHFPSAGIDAFVVIRITSTGIIVLKPQPRSLGAVVSGLKATASRELRSLGLWDAPTFWQRDYNERIIRDDDELVRVHSYIADNPANWSRDWTTRFGFGTTNMTAIGHGLKRELYRPWLE